MNAQTRKRIQSTVVVAVVAVLLGGVFLFRQTIWRGLAATTAAMTERWAPEKTTEDDAKKEPPQSIVIDDRATRNLGLKVVQVMLADYSPTINVAGEIAEIPGRSRVQVAAPMTGIITAIDIAPGAVIEPSSRLFALRLTHEELVAAQGEYLKLNEELAVVEQDIQLLEGLTQGVGVQNLRLRKYEKQRLIAERHAKRQQLILHGLSETQVDHIRDTNELIQAFEIEPPIPAGDESRRWHVQSLNVELGEHVVVGRKLAVIAAHDTLLVEGAAYEEDATIIRRLIADETPVSMLVWGDIGPPEKVSGLLVRHLADHVDDDNRVLEFHVRLPNVAIEKDTPSTDQTVRHEFLDWKYKPGQHVEILLPKAVWKKRLVVPAAAVVREGASRFLYLKKGDAFTRTPVSVEFADERSAVLYNDGAVFPGDKIASEGAYQMHLALKSQAGDAPVDPHHGHSH